MFRKLFYMIVVGGVVWFGADLHPTSSAYKDNVQTFLDESPIAQGIAAQGLTLFDMAWQQAAPYLPEMLQPREAGEGDEESNASNEVETNASNEEDVAEVPAQQPVTGDAGGEQKLAQYRAWISEARARHPYSESEERMYAVMMCESNGKAGAENPAGPYSGLFQYGADTWGGDWNTYSDQDIFDPRAQIFATALAWNNGMQGQWGCY